MMELVRRGDIHCIIVKDLSRFGREYLEVGAYLELILPLFGTRFISVGDAFDSNDYIGTTGGMELALRNLVNGMYSKDLSLKIRSAVKPATVEACTGVVKPSMAIGWIHQTSTSF